MEPNSKEDNAMSFETTKIRGAKEMRFTSGMDWDTLRISPISIDKPAPAAEKEKTKIKRVNSSDEPAQDLPWNT